MGTTEKLPNIPFSLSKTYLKASFRAIHLTFLLEANFFYHFRPQKGRKYTSKYSGDQGGSGKHASCCLISRFNYSKNKKKKNSLICSFFISSLTLTSACTSWPLS